MMCYVDTVTNDYGTAAALCNWLGERGFVSGARGRVHRHPATGARVVIRRTDPLELTVRAYAGLWVAQLNRVPFVVIAATVDAALDRKDQ